MAGKNMSRWEVFFWGVALGSVAGLIACSASAGTIPRAEPIPVYDGLLMYPDNIEGRHSFGPADGIDFWLGKGSQMPRDTVGPLKGGYSQYVLKEGTSHANGNPPFGCPGFGNAVFCGNPSDPPVVTPTSPVPLPAAVWMLLAAMGTLLLTKRKT